ncbi:FGGY family carbohydrate kinase [Leucobacter aridicollis]|uniref:ATP:glycerol 3-phosphotransferase n=1 Tax=Leucobacter aridicollis TaxID=283878 RepID=A0A852R1N5_9MICO|nr:FGGY family carbohydrate kinase [Leucobacter aridicollis]MBL3683336.1 glycerol kinase [Leucobacter aridicollis]NYD25575.1 glycerol kinase [Leucobacter aridicollis]
MKQAILAIDEGTTGTRAAWVTADGDVGGLTYERLTVSSPRPGVVVQSAAEILEKTVRTLRSAYASAVDHGLEVTAVTIATQRATATLWDTETGEPVAPSMVWQDTQYADELANMAGAWDDTLWRSIGRPTGVRSVYLWAAKTLADPAQTRARECRRKGTLGFGTVDTWLLWSLSNRRELSVTATNAVSSGAYLLTDHAYHTGFVEALGFPLELLPELRDDSGDFGTLRPDILGIELPIVAAAGDQHAAMIGLGVIDAGDVMCVHGTGSFVDLNLGTHLPDNDGRYQGALSLVAWRTGGVSRYSIETFTSTTGSAIDWLVDKLRLFESGAHISELAARGTRGAVHSVPALTGVRMPRVNAGVGALIGGMSMSTTREDVALAVLEGIAQSVAWSIDADQEVAGIEIGKVNVGGGLSGSDPLVQLQADITGVPHYRFRDTDKASLRGIAFLGGVDLGMWDSLHDTRELLGTPDVFEPTIGADEREERVDWWRRRVLTEMDLADARKDSTTE